MKLTTLLTMWLLVVNLLCISTSASANEKSLAQQEITQAVTNLIEVVDRSYLHDDKRVKIVQHLTAALERGEFDGYFPFARLKKKLESTLFTISNDSSFEIHSRSGLSDSMDTAGVVLPGAIQAHILDNNIGYLAIDGDFLEDNWRKDVSNAIEFLSDSKALIIDLRTAGLTSLSFSQYFLSYFFPADHLLSQLTFGDGETLSLTSENVANPLQTDVPVFIVTSPFVAGSWEFVAHTLQHANRATIVGMPTMGLGHMTTTSVLSEHVSLVMAYAEFQNPKASDGWKDQGVEPDVRSETENAMEVTLQLANDSL